MLDRRPDICSLQQRFKEHIRSQGLLKRHFEDYNISPFMNMVRILEKAEFDRSLTLKALFISEIRPTLNTKDEYKSWI